MSEEEGNFLVVDDAFVLCLLFENEILEVVDDPRF